MPGRWLALGTWSTLVLIGPQAGAGRPRVPKAGHVKRTVGKLRFTGRKATSGTTSA
jgi:hypothetical protein